MTVAEHPSLKEFTPEVEAIAVAIGETNLPLPVGDGLWMPCDSAHWHHIWEHGCAICKAGAAPYALRLVIERVLELAAEEAFHGEVIQ